MLHVTTTNLLLVGVFAHLLLSAAKMLFKTPKQQAQIDTIETKVDTVLSQVEQIAPAALIAPAAAAPGSSSSPALGGAS
jgi:hypothetical protein